MTVLDFRISFVKTGHIIYGFTMELLIPYNITGLDRQRQII